MHTSELKADLRRRHLYLTLDGQAVIDFWIGISRGGGLCFGPSIKGSDLHHTVWPERDKFRYLVKHKGIKRPNDESPIGGQKSTKMVIDRIEGMLRRRLKKYHGNKTCWTFTSSRWERIQSLLPKVDVEGDVYMPLEFLFTELEMDFSRNDLWRKVKIKSLLMVEPYFGFLETKRGLRLIKPVSKNEVLAWPLSKADEIQEYFARVLGFGEFFEYLARTEEGKRLSSETRSRIKQLSKS